MEKAGFVHFLIRIRSGLGLFKTSYFFSFHEFRDHVCFKNENVLIDSGYERLAKELLYA